ncbi:PAS domain S-box protein [Antarcticibacterium arcticum]|uniref:histidine kinase n=1 Tax=Antarcticibacterium arcticum TaxID=2585771 RepID=A0A5B8YGV8_9FLAO|nr:PAS domain-containing sensor histidine kinase [Antarcticibacterium arcticum]QED37014.1 PAS domain S-box protein [Antarcticibacterium arcticum]
MISYSRKNNLFTLIQKNSDAFNFTQEFGIHGTFIVDLSSPHQLFPNKRFLHSLGYPHAHELLQFENTVVADDLEVLNSYFDRDHFSENDSEIINFIHQKGFTVRMETKCLKIDSKTNEPLVLLFAVKKTFDFSQIENNPHKLFEKEKLLETVLETIDVGIISCNNLGQLTLFNKAARRWHGLPPKEIPREEWAEYYSLYEPDGTTLFKTEDIPLVELLTRGTISKPDMYIKPEKGKPRFITCNGSRIYDEENKLTGAVVALYDISKRKKAEKKLKISEETFRGSFENAVNGMAIANPMGIFTEVNDSLCNMIGYTEEELKKLHFLDVTHPHDKAGDINDLGKLLSGEWSSLQKEKRFIHKNGNSVFSMLSVSVVKNNHDQPLELIAQITDISALKETEKELKVTLSKLENILAASTRVSIIGLDVNGVITTFNTGAENLLGYTKKEVIGKKTFADLHFEKETSEITKQLKETTGKRFKEEEVFKYLTLNSTPDTREWIYHCKNGEVLPVQLTISSIEENGEPIGYLCVGTDISALKAAEKEITAVLEIATDHNQRLRNFAHIVSHNLRSHSGNFEMLLEIFREEYPDLKDNEIVEMLLKASENLKETVAHLNEVAKINTSISENLQPQNLHNAVDHALDSIRAIIQRSGLQVYIEIPENFEVLAVPAYLESIVLNFATNAIKYRSEERTPFLKFVAVKTNKFIELTIEDNGVGIDLNKHGKNLFGMYKTFHSHEDAKGIGLFITKNQIEALGGEIKVESEVGKGTVFKVSFRYE